MKNFHLFMAVSNLQSFEISSPRKGILYEFSIYQTFPTHT
jgi:hypothetical protein